jgi:two-component system LytT family sensor kinase
MSSRASSSWPSRLEWGIILAFWGTFALLAVGQGAFGDEAARFEWGEAAGELVEYGLWALLTPLVFRFVAAFPVVETISNEYWTALRNIILHVITIFAVAIVIDISEDIIIEPLVATGSGNSVPIWEQIRRFWFLDELVVYLVVLMAGFARTYYTEKKRRQEEAERLEERTQSLEAQLTEARLEALRMQLNPHFLFNTLHAISTLVDRDPAGVRRMIARLSELLRHVLDEEAPQEVPLSEELDFLEDYLEIQSIRFQGDLDTEIDVPPAIRDAQVPNLILQPIVENAIKHGASQVRGVGRIDIRGRREGEHLVLMVEDNGPGLPAAQEDGLGLRNVQARLQALYGEEQALRLTSTEEGTRTTLKLPCHTSTDLYTAEGSATLSAAVAEPTAE